MNDDATKPRRADVFPPDYTPEQLESDDEGSGGPGCLAWGIMGVFGIFMALAIVVTAIFSGFNQGLDIARVTSAAATSQNSARQCDVMPSDIAEGRFAVLEARFEALTIDGVLADCAEVFVQQATIVYEQSLITLTQPATATIMATEIPATIAPTQASETNTEVPVVQATSDSPYDLDALLQEARDFIAVGNFEEAIITLDAIRAIDPNYDSQTVNGLLYNSLSQRALNLFRSEGGSLAEAILLTNRAEQFGNIQTNELSFERSVAELYLDAQANLGVNYTLAIQYLNGVISLSPNYPRGTGQAAASLREQYEAYGDALLLGGDACLAASQFANALASSPNNVALQTKVTNANQQCSLGVPATADPNATVDPNVPTTDPNVPTVPPATATQGVAPVGQS
ncbi:MAG: hypothetical protein Phog2KO_44060 [Phototrophicaceae bacterium]